ncbi:hypothetical protein UFOVP230_53 [uncultured Caudovirales phage]|uniref:Uncharacterized protein n=1 Tax=uncultured Caudovirales phage TaxID=2100421 RepID=A0A6J7XNH1_9CAUD|nr:hypothetical protein UFOVP230_53 [uncultured Caudovirales phage]
MSGYDKWLAIGAEASQGDDLESLIDYELSHDYHYGNPKAIEEAICNDALTGEHLQALAKAMNSGSLEEVGKAFAAAIEEYCAHRAEQEAIDSLEYQ